MPIPFKQLIRFERRKAESAHIRAKYSDHVPIVCEKAPGSDASDIDKPKFLVPLDITAGEFMYIIRRRMNICPEKSIFLFIDDEIPQNNAKMSVIYDEHKDPDGFLYITYTGENTFGACL
ncbi:Autophagy-related protein [Arthroderma uncinatum]|uniref:Autophagy-related protein n=1 Tax=Arthroderma uncinatum TaxID=74035 RepID=UPI00144A5E0D|nr:Autophagy-related protein [Arthroderma uncinatum]KAF3491036.1 Autophagy-related protein [Arthroderma uncinatum]